MTSCWISRRRPLPSAWRIAISRRRAAPRARSRLARFRQATTRTSPAMNISSAASVPIGPSPWGCELTPIRGMPGEHERLILVGGRMFGFHPPGERVERAFGRLARNTRPAKRRRDSLQSDRDP